MPLSGDKIMIYQSTRGHEKKVSALTAIREGIAPDGGLYIPLEIPSVSKESFEKMKDMSYPERAAFVIKICSRRIFPSNNKASRTHTYCKR